MTIAPSEPPRRRWRVVRHVAIVLLALALGVATTIAVAWQISRTGPEFDQSRTPARWSHAKGAAWLYRLDSSSGATRVRGQFASAAAAGNHMAVPYEPPPTWSMMAQPDIAPDAPQALWEEAFGWPRPAMMSRLEESPRMTVPARVINGIVINSNWGAVLRGRINPRPDYLPTRPIWSGMIIDSGLFAVAWWIILLVLLLLLRLALRLPGVLRRRRGRCPDCGYDLRGDLDHGCSECGWQR